MTYDSNRVYDISLNEIHVEEDFNCRGTIDYVDVIELARDIEKNGLDSPITLRPFDSADFPDKKFQIVAGFRRLAAHKLNKATTIRSLVKTTLNDVDARIHNLRENLQRSNLTMKQEAYAISHLKFLNRHQIAERINKSDGWVQTRIYLLELPDEIQNEAAAGLLNTTQIRECAGLGNAEDQYEYVRRIKDRILQGKKKEVKVEDVRSEKNETRIRSADEIEEKQDLIRETLGNCLATKALGWSGGHLDDCVLYEAIRAEAKKVGKEFHIPEEFGCKV